jgi:hypothetical protein
MIKRKLLSVIIPATELGKLKKSLDSSLQFCRENETQFIIAYPKKNIEIKMYLKKMKRAYRIKALQVIKTIGRKLVM